MKVKVNQFCGLSTSPQIQAWLFRYDEAIYNDFTEVMKNSKGCHHNRDNMQRVYDKIVAKGDLEKLVNYLKTHFPHVVEADDAPPEEPVLVPSGAEKDFTLNVLQAMKDVFNRRTITFPRRTVVPVTGFDPDVAIESFKKDKIAIKWIVLDNVLYIEYLTKADESIKDSILETNWLVPYMEGMITGETQYVSQ